MAGKFLSIEEAAEHLGVTTDRVRQLVDRRLISALRDTAGPKFRVEDLDRYLAEAAEDATSAEPQQPESIAASAESIAAGTQESGLSLDGLELDLGDSAEASIIIQDSDAKAAPPPAVEKNAADSSAPAEEDVAEDELALASGIDLDDLQLASGPSLTDKQQATPATANDEASLVLGDDVEAAAADDSLVIGADDEQADSQPLVAPADEASLVLGDDLEDAPADGPQTLVGADDSLVIGEDEPADAKPAAAAEDQASLVLGDDLEDAAAAGPDSIIGADDSLVIGAEDAAAAKPQDLADAASLVAGDDIAVSGLDMSLAGSLSGLELGDADPAASQAAGGSAVQGGSLGGSFGSDLDLESLVAGSAIAADAAAESIVAPDSLAGSDLLGDDLAVAEPTGAEGSGILVDSGAGSGAGDVGSAISGGSGVIMEGGIDLTGDDVKPWDVDLGEFMNDVEEDADAPTMLGGDGEFDLDAATTAEDPSQSADLASESQVGGDSSFFDKSQGPADSSFFGQSVGGTGDGLGDATPLSEMASSSMLGGGLATTKFTGWQVTGLVCCSLLLLIGGLLTFDLVRTIGSPADTPLANPIVGGLATAFGWK